MANSTSKLSLRQPQSSDPVNVDADINANMDVIDANINYRLCTSSNRPSPVAGLKIFETDTQSLLIYTGTQWRYLNPGGGVSGSFPKGRVTHNTYTANLTSALTTSEPVNPQLSFTFTSELNRYYWAELFYNIRHSAGTTGVRVYLNVRVGTGASVTNAGAQLGKTARASNNWGINTIITAYRMWEYLAPSAGQKTIGWFWWKDAADSSQTVDIYASAAEPARMLIRDVGA